MSSTRKSGSATPDLSPEILPSPSPRAKPLPLRLPLVPGPGYQPELVPARMINEVLYCERLMYLEWVQGEWADNYFTVDGKAVHRRVDRPGRPLEPREGSGPNEAGDAPKEVKEAEGAEGVELSKAKGRSRAADSDSEGPSEERPYQARTVWLSSEALGVTAKLDLVEVDGGAVVPVEYKRGSCPNVPERAYLPERAQLCIQVLLLREHGYTCDHGEIYYAEERRRVPIDIDDWLVTRTLCAIDRARALAQEATLPPPLEDSPKCNGCSLVGICLPDETRLLATSSPALALEAPAQTDSTEAVTAAEPEPDPWGFMEGGEEKPVRRLFPARDDRLPVYVQTQGASMRLQGERLIIQSKDEPAREARLTNTSHVAVFGNVHVTTPVIRKLLDAGVPLLFFSYGGWFLGQTMAHDSKNVELRLAQYAATLDTHRSLQLARAFVASKILNSRTLLRRNYPEVPAAALTELKHLARKARDAHEAESLLGIEGTAARRYFGEFPGMLKDSGDGAFDFEGRNRRPPRDPVNALLSFCYSLLTKEVVLAIRAAGLDPMLGFYHRPHFGRPSLALDLMEEFRPVLADSTVISALNNAVIQPSDFIRSAGSVALTTPARKRLIQTFERRLDQLVTHPVFDYRISYRRVLEVQARLLTRYLLGEIPAYPEFRIR